MVAYTAISKRDDEGYLYIVDRKKTWCDGRMNVFPPVEDASRHQRLQTPPCLECGYKWGEAVTRRRGASRHASGCGGSPGARRERKGPIKHLSKFFSCKLAYNGLGKIDKKALRATYGNSGKPMVLTDLDCQRCLQGKLVFVTGGGSVSTWASRKASRPWGQHRDLRQDAERLETAAANCLPWERGCRRR